VRDVLAEANRLITLHSEVSRAMTAERTALESALIPVTPYILVSAAECWYRHPDMVRAIDAAMPAEEIGRAGRRPGQRVNAVHLWSIANIYLLGRKIITAFDPPSDTPERTLAVLDFWERAARAFRADGQVQAWHAGFTVRPYDGNVIDTLVGGATAVDDPGERVRLGRFCATLSAYLFLLYFDTRVGTGDTGPYPLPGGRTLLVRDFYRLGPSEFAWSSVAEGMPYQNLTAALVLDGADVKVNDWGTSITEPEDYVERLVAFGLFTSDGGALRPVPLDELDAIVAAVRAAQSRLYRSIALMSRDEKIACGAYVYFGFLRPFAEMAGIAGDLDWSVPRDIPGPLYDLFAQFEGGQAEDVPEEEYYARFPEEATG